LTAINDDDDDDDDDGIVKILYASSDDCFWTKFGFKTYF
jgi:hypothetical protein